VTTGTSGSWPPNGFLTVGVASGKSWSGTDGKYESYAGTQRLKWNPYSVRGSAYLCSDALFKCYQYYLTDPSFVVDFSQPPSLNLQPGSSVNDYGGISDTDKNRALTKLLAKIKEHDFNLGVDLGQMKQTVNLLSGNLGKLGRAALALRRGDFSTAARQLGAHPRGTRLKPSDISGRWLELQYGWLPLLSSCYGAAEAFAAISSGPRKRVFIATGSTKLDWNLSQSPVTYQALVKGKIGRRIQYEMYEEMSVARNLGLEDPLSVAWELTPWSFVIDWFYPIGNYLSNLNQIPKLKGRWILTDFVKFDKQKVNLRWLNMAPPWGPLWGFVVYPPAPQLTWLSTVSNRVYSDTPPAVPLPKFNLKGLNSSRRFWNAVSLAHQRFLR
jgi:hypothetical protein